MKLNYYVVDAFAERAFGGNPAGVCVLDSWLPDALMQSIAAENRLSETAFCVRNADGTYDLRWFTPACEIDLCGHATFGTAFTLFSFYEQQADEIRFHAPMKGYELVCRRDGDRIQMDFPYLPPAPLSNDVLLDAVADALGVRPVELLATERDLVAMFAHEDEVRCMKPDFAKVAALEQGLSVYATAPAADVDYVARAFWPKIGINEDPVCGSMQSALVPLWSQRLGKRDLVCFEPSERGGTVWCEDCDNMVRISGHGKVYLRGEIEVG